MSIAERFESVRKMFHLNQGQFGKMLGITSSLVSAMESGRATVSRKTMKKLTERLGINPIWIEYGVGDMYISEEMTTEKILDDNPSVKAVYDAWTDKDLEIKKKVEERQKKIAERAARHQDAADRMKTFREHFLLNQNQLAKRIGVTRALISAVENGKNLISDTLAARISEEFDVSAVWLTDGTGEMLNTSEPVRSVSGEPVSGKPDFDMLAKMFCILTDKAKDGDWDTLSAICELLDQDTGIHEKTFVA